MLLSYFHQESLLLKSYLIEDFAIEPPIYKPIIVLFSNFKLRELHEESINLFHTIIKVTILSKHYFSQEADRVFTQSDTKTV